MDERTERLLQKAETAIDQNNTDQAEAYAMLAARTAYLRRREAREMSRALGLLSELQTIKDEP